MCACHPAPVRGGTAVRCHRVVSEGVLAAEALAVVLLTRTVALGLWRDSSYLLNLYFIRKDLNTVTVKFYKGKWKASLGLLEHGLCIFIHYREKGKKL